MLDRPTAANFPIPAFGVTDRLQKLSFMFPAIDAIFQEFATQRHIPGLAFGIVMDGELVHSGALGVRNVAEQAPVMPDTQFRIASMTKSFTAMAIVKLRDEGKLHLEEAAAHYVPELAALTYPTRDSAPITVRQLLTMSGGFPQDDPWADRQLAASADQFTVWLREGISFSNPPGAAYEYSNYSYAILGRIIDNVSGMRFQDYIKQSILEPLGMMSSTFDVHAVAPDRLATGYRFDADNWIAQPLLEDGAFGAMGGLFTTVPDFARYIAFLLAAFPPRDDAENGPIRRSSAREMQQAARSAYAMSHRPMPDMPAIVMSYGYGYGLSAGVHSIFGYTVGHGGGLPGYGSYYRMLPDCGIGLVAFTNLTYAQAALPIDAALSALQRADNLQRRTLAVSAALQTTRAGLLDLYAQWDDAKAAALTTESFYQDMPIDKRRAQFEQLRADFGACLSATALEPENALRGYWTLHCERGQIEMFMTLAPTVPPRLQYLVMTLAKPLSDTLRHAATQLVRLLNYWDNRDSTKFRTILAPSLKWAALSIQLEAVRVQCGTLQLGDTLESDGETYARVRLNGEKAPIDAHLKIDPKTRKISAITFSKPRETPFAP